MIHVTDGTPVSSNERDVLLSDKVDDSLSDVNGEVEVIVQFNDDRFHKSSDKITVSGMKENMGTKQSTLSQYAQEKSSVELKNQFWLGNLALLSVNTDKTSIARLANIEGVKSISRHGSFHRHKSEKRVGYQSSDSKERGITKLDNYSTTYGLDIINATPVWSRYETRGSNTSVFVLDTGVDASHQDINISGWNEFDSTGSEVDSNPYDLGIHGTHVTGTVAGGNKSGEYIGVAPNTDVHHGKVFQSEDSATFAAVVSGIQWAVENDADVVTMSLGAKGYYNAQGIIQVIRDAQSSGTMVIASIGNDGVGTSGTPGNIYNVTSVGAVGSSERPYFASSGEEINTSEDWGLDAPEDWPNKYIVPSVSAPGVSVKSSTPNNRYSRLSGTSMSAPHIAGSVSLILSATNEEFNSRTVRMAIEDTAYKPEDSYNESVRDTRYGSGIIDVYAATEILDSPLNIKSLNIPKNVSASNKLEFNYTLENKISNTVTEDIEFIVNGEVKKIDKNVTVPPKEQIKKGFKYKELDQFAGQEISVGVQATGSKVTRSAVVDIKGEEKFEIVKAYSNPTNRVNETEDYTALVEIKNTGSLDGEDKVELKTPIGNDSRNIILNSGENTTINLSIPTEFGDKGQYSANILTDDDNAKLSFYISKASAFYLEIQDKFEPIEGGKLSMVTEVTNTKNRTETQRIVSPFKSGDKSNITLSPNESRNISLSIPTSIGDAGLYNITVSSEDYSINTAIEIKIPVVNNGKDNPNDMDYDGKYEDVNGDGSFNIFDVQSLFNNLEEPAIQNHKHAYDFDNDGSVNIFDVQTLFGMA